MLRSRLNRLIGFVALNNLLGSEELIGARAETASYLAALDASSAVYSTTGWKEPGWTGVNLIDGVF